MFPRVSPYGPSASVPVAAGGEARRRDNESMRPYSRRATGSHTATAVESIPPSDSVGRRGARINALARSHGVPICAVCAEPIRGMVCHRGASQVHFGCGGASAGEELELERLEPCQERALQNVRDATQILHDAALPRLRERVEALGFEPHDADTTLTWIREQAPVLIHVDLAQFGAKLAADTHYRNQFETSCSSGCLSTSSRTRWEEDLFGDAYHDATSFERCKYGVLNVTNDPQGVRACSQYGLCYLLLRNVRFRTTFSAQDSAGLCIDRLATVDYYAHVLEHYQDDELRAAVEVGTRQAFGRDSRAIQQYKEAQIHGEVRLADHVELIMLHPSLRASTSSSSSSMLDLLSERCGCAPIVWMEASDGSSNPSGMEGGHEFDEKGDYDGTGGDAVSSAGYLPPAAPVMERDASALPSEDEDLMQAIAASQLIARESRTAKEVAELAEAEELEQAMELSKSLIAEEDEIASAIRASLSASAVLCASDSSTGTSAAVTTEDSDLAKAISLSLAETEEAKRRKARCEELEAEVAMFAVECAMDGGDSDGSAMAAEGATIIRAKLPAMSGPLSDHVGLDRWHVVMDSAATTNEGLSDGGSLGDAQASADGQEICQVCDGSGLLLRDPCPLCTDAMDEVPGSHISPTEMPALAVCVSALPSVEVVQLDLSGAPQASLREANDSILETLVSDTSTRSCEIAAIDSRSVACELSEKNDSLLVGPEAELTAASLDPGPAVVELPEVEEEALTRAIQASLEAAENDRRLEALELDEILRAIKASQGFDD